MVKNKLGQWLSFFLMTAFFLLIESGRSYAQDQYADLSGTWKGEGRTPYASAYEELYLDKLGTDTYTGILSLKWRNNNDKRSYDDPSLPLKQVRLLILARFDGSIFTFNCIDTVLTVRGTPFALSKNVKLNFANSSGEPELSVNDGKNSGYLKKINAAIPEEFSRYFINRSTLLAEDFSYNNPTKTSTIKYNSSGYLTLQLHNRNEINLNNLYLVLRTEEEQHGIIGLNNMKGNLSLRKQTSQSFSMPLPAGFSIPGDSLHLILTISLDGIAINILRLTLTTDPFMKSNKVVVPEYTSARMKAVSGYYGFLNTPYEDVSKPLDALATAGDKTAGMWKAMFLYMGYGGYKIDENLGWSLARNNLQKVENDARNGDAESLYLMYYAIQMGLLGQSAMNGAEGLLKMAADAGFKPAVYDYGLYSFIRKDYKTSQAFLQKSYDMGVKKAAVGIGLMYEHGFSLEKDIAQAKEWYTKGVAFGDPDAMLKLALLYSAGEDAEPDINKAIDLATKASAKRCRGAMLFLGGIYYQGTQGKATNIPLALKWFKEAVDLGDREGMMILGAMYLQDNLPGLPKDVKTGYFWLRKAAELGETAAMKLLSKIYIDGEIAEKNVIKSRYWYNQAVLKGAAERNDVDTRMEDFLNIWKYADFSPSYVYVNRYGDVVGDSGPDFLGGMLGGLLNSYLDSRMRSQPVINGLEYICDKRGKKIYGGTITSRFMTGLRLTSGQTVHIESYGAVTLGFMLSGISADGIADPMYAGYSIVPAIRHGAVIAGMNNNWQFVGRNGFYTASQDGMLNLAVNDADYTNNQGYFDLVAEVQN